MTSSNTKKRKKPSLPKVKNIVDEREMPRLYVGFPDSLAAAVRKMEEIEGKLISRGYKPVKPYDIYRLTIKKNVYDVGKKKKTVARKIESVTLGFRLEEVK